MYFVIQIIAVYLQKKFKTKIMKYRIRKVDGRFLNAGTGLDSWFTLENARKIVNYEKGEIIVESDGVNILWEIL